MEKLMKTRILLTAGRLPYALELARSLAQAGAEVFVADCYPLFVCQASAAVRRSFRLPPPAENFPEFRRQLLDLVQREKIDLLIPVSEEVIYLSLMRTELAALCRVFFPDFSLLQTLHHKQRFVAYAQRLGLGVPDTVAYQGQTALPSFASRPYIIKRCYSRAGCQVYFPSAGRHPQGFGLPPDGSWIMQEKAPGEPLCSVSVLRGGKVALTRLYRPTSAFGTVSVVFTRVEHAQVEAWIETFAAHSLYEGLISFDFFVCGDAVRAIECNPRPTSGLHLCEPELLAAALLELPLASHAPAARLRAQIVLGVLSALPQIVRQGKWQSLWPELLRARDVIFSWRDPAPFFFQLFCYLYFFWRMFFKRQSLMACMMDGVEWNEDGLSVGETQKSEVLSTAG